MEKSKLRIIKAPQMLDLNSNFWGAPPLSEMLFSFYWGNCNNIKINNKNAKGEESKAIFCQFANLLYK
ncbi:hypothetical protein [Planococcus salinarum]|uniref:hypothetical protein n=1 Tax=Planococcus salinarum TaxID=622695 RepID=UPI00115ECAEF|nr:hypothetical protein [Planococcus salinarum]TAA68731.1 hypothetical protein D2909_13675 [Planococcus salinarum]